MVAASAKAWSSPSYRTRIDAGPNISSESSGVFRNVFASASNSAGTAALAGCSPAATLRTRTSPARAATALP